LNARTAEAVEWLTERAAGAPNPFSAERLRDKVAVRFKHELHAVYLLDRFPSYSTTITLVPSLLTPSRQLLQGD
jgi:hypothetical protein